MNELEEQERVIDGVEREIDALGLSTVFSGYRIVVLVKALRQLESDCHRLTADLADAAKREREAVTLLEAVRGRFLDINQHGKTIIDFQGVWLDQRDSEICRLKSELADSRREIERAKDAGEIVGLINTLRKKECEYVTINSPNADFGGPNECVEIGSLIDNSHAYFHGDTLIDALRKAAAASTPPTVAPEPVATQPEEGNECERIAGILGGSVVGEASTAFGQAPVLARPADGAAMSDLDDVLRDSLPFIPPDSAILMSEKELAAHGVVILKSEGGFTWRHRDQCGGLTVNGVFADEESAMRDASAWCRSRHH